eukprot:CAMPEP_0168739236 /NCGR_PEP_ID=MMETSP0724-20121128/11349_1 /TAXON_ID=265536 /ORGANISM="Amphiprora sp., Strain CCMP467" /LENGTH=145 /DNA_ID=CAMNT_0008786613 /DNA_START=511 /DNA_END=946 /DNA_ORIENTATION=-
MIITTVVWRFLRRRWKDILKYCCSEWAERQGWMPNIEEDEEAEALQAAEEGYGTITGDVICDMIGEDGDPPIKRRKASLGALGNGIGQDGLGARAATTFSTVILQATDAHPEYYTKDPKRQFWCGRMAVPFWQRPQQDCPLTPFL